MTKKQRKGLVIFILGAWLSGVSMLLPRDLFNTTVSIIGGLMMGYGMVDFIKEKV